jgi:ankyrin repeat protein
MALVNKIFWSIAAAEALFFIVAIVMTAMQSGPNPDGGKGMGIIFGGVAPFLLLAIITFIFWKTSSPTLHIILLIAVTIPAAMLAGQWLRGPLMDRDIAVGGYLYTDTKMKKFVAAVSKMDAQTVRALAPGIDVNTQGFNGTTPLVFAVEKVATTGDSQETTAKRLEMVRLLVSLGANPDVGLPTACASDNPTVIGVLLSLGANPNYKDAEGTPAFFYCSGNPAGLEKLRLLSQKGADFSALDHNGTGALINAATFSQWDKMLFFLEHGVQDTATVNGKNAAAMVKQAIVDDKQNSRETAPALHLLATKLNN